MKILKLGWIFFRLGSGIPFGWLINVWCYLVKGCFRAYLGLIWDFFRVSSGLVQDLFRVYLGLVLFGFESFTVCQGVSSRLETLQIPENMKAWCD